MFDHKVFYFINVIEEGSFSAAARKLYLSQPALSKQITFLEKELNMTLLDRSGYRPRLTEIGQQYYDGIKQLYSEYTDLIRHLQSYTNQEIRVAMPGLMENKKVTLVLNKIRKEQPNLQYTFTKSTFENAATLLKNQEVDLSFSIESSFVDNEKIQYTILHPYEMCVITSFDHSLAKEKEVTPSQLNGEKMILLSRKYGEKYFDDFIKSCKLDGMQPSSFKQVSSFDEMIFEVSIGNGIAIVSKDVVTNTEVKVINLINSHHHNNFTMAYLKEKQIMLSPIIQAIETEFENYN